MSDAQPRGNRLGWLQFVFGLAVIVGQGLWWSRGLADQAEANTRTSEQLSAAMSKNTAALNQRIDSINDNLAQMARSLERISEHQTVRDQETERRLKRLEDERDGKRG